MNKYKSLIKATLSSDMNLFKVYNRKNSVVTKVLVPILLAAVILTYIGFYSVMIIKQLAPVHLEYIVISLFTFVTFLITIIEGVYKSSSLLFECKDDNLLLSLPIKRSTVLFIRFFKFYLFELLFNSLFLIPSIVVYPFFVPVGISYYITSIIMVFLLPIIPIILSIIIGFFTSYLSTKSNYKNIIQTIISFIFIVAIIIFSYNTENLFNKFAEKAQSINEVITKIYYPAGLYSELVTNFNIWKLLVFIVINAVLVFGVIKLLSNIYFKINSESKSVKVKKSKHKVKVNKSGVTKSIIKKEINRFINSPVYAINTVAGLVFYLIFVVAIIVKFDGVIESVLNDETVNITRDMILGYMPIVSLGLIFFASFMSSITNSMISLEGKAFSILKTLPIKPITIIMAKVYTAVVIMVPIILIGNIAMFIYFKYNIITMLLLVILCVLLPLVSETLGIIVNLKYPKMNALNDTEVVKQSMSSFIAVLIGMIVSAGSIALIIKLVMSNINMYIILGCTIVIYAIIFALLYLYLLHRGTKDFNRITV